MSDNSVLIRKASLNDYGAIYVLNKNSLGYDFDVERTRERLQYILTNKHNIIFVAEKNSRVIGYVHGAEYDCVYAKSMKNILSIAVDEEYQGIGVGKTLLGAIEKWAAESGSVAVRLVSGVNREKAHQFYLACGYTIRKCQKNFIKSLYS